VGRPRGAVYRGGTRGGRGEGDGEGEGEGVPAWPLMPTTHSLPEGSRVLLPAPPSLPPPRPPSPSASPGSPRETKARGRGSPRAPLRGRGGVHRHRGDVLGEEGGAFTGAGGMFWGGWAGRGGPEKVPGRRGRLAGGRPGGRRGRGAPGARPHHHRPPPPPPPTPPPPPLPALPLPSPSLDHEGRRRPRYTPGLGFSHSSCRTRSLGPRYTPGVQSRRSRGRWGSPSVAPLVRRQSLETGLERTRLRAQARAQGTGEYPRSRPGPYLRRQLRDGTPAPPGGIPPGPLPAAAERGGALRRASGAPPEPGDGRRAAEAQGQGAGPGAAPGAALGRGRCGVPWVHPRGVGAHLGRPQSEEPFTAPLVRRQSLETGLERRQLRARAQVLGQPLGGPLAGAGAVYPGGTPGRWALRCASTRGGCGVPWEYSRGPGPVCCAPGAPPEPGDGRREEAPAGEGAGAGAAPHPPPGHNFSAAVPYHSPRRSCVPPSTPLQGGHTHEAEPFAAPLVRRQSLETDVERRRFRARAQVLRQALAPTPTPQTPHPSF